MGNLIKQAIKAVLSNRYECTADGDTAEVWDYYDGDVAVLAITGNELVITREYDGEELERRELCDENGNPEWGIADLIAIIDDCRLPAILEGIRKYILKARENDGLGLFCEGGYC